jgi:hypothetical protein
MALTRLNGINAITGTIPQGNIANASLGAVTALPAAIPTGKVLQHVKVSSGSFDASSGNWNITGETLTNTGRTVNITPTASNSIITGTGFVTYGCDNSSVSDLRFYFRINRDSGSPSSSDPSVSQGSVNYWDREFNASQQTRWDSYRMIPMHLYDNSHSTTSQITYRLYCAGSSTNQNRGGMLYLDLFEIGA